MILKWITTAVSWNIPWVWYVDKFDGWDTDWNKKDEHTTWWKLMETQVKKEFFLKSFINKEEEVENKLTKEDIKHNLEVVKHEDWKISQISSQALLQIRQNLKATA